MSDKPSSGQRTRHLGEVHRRYGSHEANAHSHDPPSGLEHTVDHVSLQSSLLSAWTMLTQGFEPRIEEHHQEYLARSQIEYFSSDRSSHKPT